MFQHATPDEWSLRGENLSRSCFVTVPAPISSDSNYPWKNSSHKRGFDGEYRGASILWFGRPNQTNLKGSAVPSTLYPSPSVIVPRGTLNLSGLAVRGGSELWASTENRGGRGSSEGRGTKRCRRVWCVEDGARPAKGSGEALQIREREKPRGGYTGCCYLLGDWGTPGTTTGTLARDTARA